MIVQRHISATPSVISATACLEGISPQPPGDGGSIHVILYPCNKDIVCHKVLELQREQHLPNVNL